MRRAGYSEKVDRPEGKTLPGTAVERQLDLLATVAPCAIVVFDLKASEVRRARTEDYTRLSILNRHLRGDDVGRPFDPVPSGALYEVRRIIGPVGFSISMPSVVPEYLVVKHDKRGGRSRWECGEAIGVCFPATPAIGVRPCFQLAGFGVRSCSLLSLAARSKDRGPAGQV